jgi:hypothetical protein
LGRRRRTRGGGGDWAVCTKGVGNVLLSLLGGRLVVWDDAKNRVHPHGARERDLVGGEVAPLVNLETGQGPGVGV